MFLKTLTELDGVSGNEDKVRDFIIENIRKYADEVLIDPMGNLIVKRSGKGKTNLFAAHMDEVGIMVTKINDDGTLSFSRVGGIMPEVIIGSRFRNGELKGVVGIKPIHLRKDYTKIPDIDDMVLDLGFSKKEEAARKVKLGDYFAFDTNFKWINKNRFITKAVDDRAGCAAIMDLFLKKELYKRDMIGLFTVQEETGTRGASGVIDYLSPDRAYIVEGTGCGDFPNPEKDRDLPRYPTLTGGPVVTIMDSAFLIDENHLKNIEKVANKYGLYISIRDRE
jgi:endoglucanase